MTWVWISLYAFVIWGLLSGVGMFCHIRRVEIVEEAGLLAHCIAPEGLDLDKLALFLIGYFAIGVTATLIGYRRYIVTTVQVAFEHRCLTVEERNALFKALHNYKLRSTGFKFKP